MPGTKKAPGKPIKVKIIWEINLISYVQYFIAIFENIINDRMVIIGE